MYHAIVLHSHFTLGVTVQHHTRHRTQKAAARSLSKGITCAKRPGPAHNTYCAVITPDRRTLSLRMAQGKVPYEEMPRNLKRMLLDATDTAFIVATS